MTFERAQDHTEGRSADSARLGGDRTGATDLADGLVLTAGLSPGLSLMRFCGRGRRLGDRSAPARSAVLRRADAVPGFLRRLDRAHFGGRLGSEIMDTLAGFVDGPLDFDSQAHRRFYDPSHQGLAQPLHQGCGDQTDQEGGYYRRHGTTSFSSVEEMMIENTTVQ
ncbi:hypothetical protein ADK64_16325 [Streptomyces sp. MMG1121]|nr:hypothetical protein ADK64_16325 [Streptomyces sp. MMG1121]